MVGPLALDLNYASRGVRRARVSVSPSGNEALPFGHSGNQSISGTHSLPVCLPSEFRLCSELRCARVASVLWPHASSSSRAAIGGRSAIERAKRRLLRRPRLRHCIGGDGGGTWPLAPPAAAAPDRSKRAEGSVTPLSPSVHRLFVLVNGHRSLRPN